MKQKTKKKKAKKDQMVEIARSFTYKKNLGNFQSADFFCSAKAECKASEAGEKSEKMYEFCKKEVLKSLNVFIKEFSGEPTIQVSEAEPKKDKNYFISQAVTDKKGMDDNDNTNGAGHNSTLIHGEIESANQTFNSKNVEALGERQK